MKSNQKKKDSMLRWMIALVVVLLVFGALSVGYFVKLSQNHKTFVKEYTTTINHARRNGGILATQGEESWEMPYDAASDIYSMIIEGGMGKPQKAMPAGEVTTLNFPDGTELKLLKTEIMEKARRRDEGVFISFTNKEGNLYQYDTDRIDTDRFFLTLTRGKP